MSPNIGGWSAGRPLFEQNTCNKFGKVGVFPLKGPKGEEVKD